MKHQRPVNLDLRTISLPSMAIVSILHRISGILLFILFPILLYAAALSLQSEAGFAQLKMQIQASLLNKLLLWVFASALLYHALAGIRHICMDLGFAESLQAGRRSSILLLLLSTILIIILGILIW